MVVGSGEAEVCRAAGFATTPGVIGATGVARVAGVGVVPVSYTHLTLPTSDLV